MDKNFRCVANRATLENLNSNIFIRPKAGEIVYCEDTQEMYVFTEKGYTLMSNETPANGGLNMSLYDLNKSIISQLKPLDDTQRSIAKTTIALWEELNPDDFYMLYGKEISYFTLFMIDKKNPEFYNFYNLSTAVFECLEAVGDICSVERTEDRSAIEIWVNVDGDATCLYLFPYGNGIVRIG